MSEELRMVFVLGGISAFVFLLWLLVRRAGRWRK